MCVFWEAKAMAQLDMQESHAGNIKERGDRTSGRTTHCNVGRRHWWEGTLRKAEKVSAKVEDSPKVKYHWKNPSWAGLWLLHPGARLWVWLAVALGDGGLGLYTMVDLGSESWRLSVNQASYRSQQARSSQETGEVHSLLASVMWLVQWQDEDKNQNHH